MPTSIHTLETHAPAKPLTDAEFQQIHASARWPLDFGRLSGCTGNCTQGRFCDCQADVPELEKAPLKDSERTWIVVLFSVSGLAMLALTSWLLPIIVKALP
jgi:hypothetical protein